MTASRLNLVSYILIPPPTPFSGSPLPFPLLYWTVYRFEPGSSPSSLLYQPLCHIVYSLMLAIGNDDHIVPIVSLFFDWMFYITCLFFRQLWDQHPFRTLNIIGNKTLTLAKTNDSNLIYSYCFFFLTVGKPALFSEFPSPRESFIFRRAFSAAGDTQRRGTSLQHEHSNNNNQYPDFFFRVICNCSACNNYKQW